uniref:Uncharacterized protein n=1 Tax=Anguilla anguilla TaxID=7936 RepID=A0A0E9XR90_ANGAN
MCMSLSVQARLQSTVSHMPQTTGADGASLSGFCHWGC